MKKFVLVICILFLTSCYDYKEINDLALVSTIIIDYDKDFNLTFEIMETLDSSYIVSSSGSTIENAFDNINAMISNNAYYNHLKVLIISSSITDNYLEEIIDYITRNPNIRNEFYIVFSENPNEIINHKENNKTLSTSISKLIESNNNTNNIKNKKVFEDFLEEIINPYTYGIIDKIGIEGNQLKIQGIAFFDNYKYVDTLSLNESKILKAIINNSNNIIINNNGTSIIIDSIKTSYKIKKDSIKIYIKAYAQLQSNNKDINIKNLKQFNNITSSLKKELNNKINELNFYLINNNYDLLSINNIYYKKYKTIKNSLKDYNISINTDLIINKKGLTFNE